MDSIRVITDETELDAAQAEMARPRIATLASWPF
jgi:hypothetical protein